jgi:hypothetical protein
MNKRLAQFGVWLWRRTAFLRSRAGLVVLAVALVGGRLLWIHVQRPPHLEANATAYGSIRNFYGPAWMNHDGSRFIYVATPDERGRALFLCDTATGKKRQIICDKQGVGYFEDNYNIQAGPWSPDDKCFVCLVSNRLMVCSADANQANAVVDDKPFSEAVWLTPTQFAYVTDQTNLCLAQKRADGQWEHRIFLSQEMAMTSLTVVGLDTVAWLEEGAIICRADLSGTQSGAGILPADSTNQPSSRMPDNTTPPASGLALWLDASKLRQPDQSPVMALADLSRQKNDAVWNGRPPVFNGTNSAGALNGLGTIRFGWVDAPTNGTGLRTRARPALIGAAPRSVFAVMRHDAGRAMMVSMGNAGTNGALFAVEGDRDRFYLPGGWYRDNQVMMTSSNWNLLEVTYDGMTQRGYINGALRGVANVKLDTATKEVEIGYRTATGGKNPKTAEGDFAELLVYDHALNNAERRQVEDYLGVKWFGKTSLSSPNPLVWFDNGLAGLTGMAYSKETEQLLLNRTQDGLDSVWLVNTADGPNATPTQIKEGSSVLGAQWAGPNQIVYATRLDTRAWIMLADLSGNDTRQLLQLWGNGTFDWFKMAPDQKQLFLFGNLSNAPTAGIWQNNLASDSWRPVISVSDFPSTDARAVITSHNTLYVPGGQVTYTLYQPANFDKKKKYPFVIGDTQINDPSHGEVFMTGLAACGACVAVVERPTWQFQLEQWETNVLALYRNLVGNPSFDSKRVYLFGQSAETTYMSRVLEDSPVLWKGAMFLNPGILPDFSKSPRFQARPRIFLDAGGEEHAENRFKKYQETALGSGAVVEFYIYPGENHRIVSSAIRLERARRVAHFIFEE